MTDSQRRLQLFALLQDSSAVAATLQSACRPLYKTVPSKGSELHVFFAFYPDKPSLRPAGQLFSGVIAIPYL